MFSVNHAIRNQQLFMTLDHKEDTLIHLIAENGHDMLEEVVAVISPLFGDSEITIFDTKEKEIVYSTLLNNDCLEDVKSRVRPLYGTEHGKFLKNRCRNGVMSSLWMALLSEEDGYAAYIEKYEEAIGVKEDALRERVLPLLAIAVRVFSLDRYSRKALSLDERTLLPTRDALIRKTKEMTGKPYNLSVLRVDDFDKIYGKSKGRGVGKLQQRIASIIRKEIQQAFLISEEKFAFLFGGALEDGFRFLERLVGQIEDSLMEEMDEHISLSAVIISSQGDPYLNIYLCESYLKENEGKILIIHEKASEETIRNGSYASPAITGDDVVDVP